MKRPDAKRLRDSVEAALERFDPAEMLPLLHRLSKTATSGSDEYLFAHRLLAMLLAEEHPWRASLHARRVLATRSTDDRAWAALGLSQALLGHFRYAKCSYERALELAPNNPWYAHNLGHLYDVALSEPERALDHLSRAYAMLPDDGDVMLAYAHALARCGQLDDAEALLSSRIPKGKEKRALMEWLTTCVLDRRLYHINRDLPRAAVTLAELPPAPAKVSTARRSSRPPAASVGGSVAAAKPSVAPAPAARPRVRGRARSKFVAFLSRELRRLPFSDKQRARAQAIALDAFYGRNKSPVLATFTDEERVAITAYAVVHTDDMPLSCAEVAATFRIPTSRVRGGFTKLRAELRLVRKDPRF